MQRKCTAHKRDGQPCGNWAIQGGTVCRMHGGSNPKVKALATVRRDLDNWGIPDGDTLDPGQTLLRLVTQSAARAEAYAAEVERMVEEHGMHDAMVGDNLIMHPETGSLTKVGEYVRGMAQLEASERDRCAKFASQAVAAGLAERQVQVAEQQASIAERALAAALEDIGLTSEQRTQAAGRLAHHLRLVG